MGALADGCAARLHSGSRMNGDVQVRFCERLGVRLPGPTHLVALAKQMGSETIEFIESRLEGKFQLEINREKTRVVNLREEGASLDFLGYTFRYDRDRKGRGKKYLNVFPSKKAVQRERTKLHEMTDSHRCFKPIPVLIGELNRHLKGWTNYFSFGYPISAYCEIERHVQGRLIHHLQRCRPAAVPASARRNLVAASGAVGADPSVGTCACLRREFSGEPDVGNLHLRFDEGRVGRATRVALSPTLPAQSRAGFAGCARLLTPLART